jgi:hypothetical protein
MRTVGRRQIGHFAYMGFPDDPTETRVARFIDLHDAAALVFPEHGAARGRA